MSKEITKAAEPIYQMNCDKCGELLDEKLLDLSHDVPKYIFKDKHEADKHGRHYLCKKCHHMYEGMVFWAMVKDLPEEIKLTMIEKAKGFARSYFKGK